MSWYTLSKEIGWGGRCPFQSRELVGTLCIKIQNLQVHPIKHFIMQPWFQKIGKLGVHQGRNLPLSLAFLARLKRPLKSCRKTESRCINFQWNCTISAARIDLNNQKINLKKEVENPILQLRHNLYLLNLTKTLLFFTNCKWNIF